MAVKTKELLLASNQLNELIPKTWTTILVNDFADVVNGGAFKSTLFNKTKGIRLIRIRDLLQKKDPTYYDGKYDEKFLINSGDFLIGMDGDFIESQAFAFLALRSILKLPISFPKTTGCKKPSTGGEIIKY